MAGLIGDNRRVNNLNEPLPAAMDGLRTIYAGLENAFGSPAASFASLTSINTFLNAVIGLLISLAVVTFFLYLFGWLMAQPGTALHSRSVRGSFRAAIVIFLMVDIWGIIRLVNNLVLLSDVTAYGIFFFAFLLLGFWSLFGAGDAFVALAVRAAEAVSAYAISFLRNRGFTRFSDNAIKFGLLLIIGGVFSLWMAFISVSQTSGERQSSSAPIVQPYSRALERGADDATVVGNRYVNSRHGIEIAFPDDWSVTLLNESDGLVAATDPMGEVYVRLNGGTFDDITEPSGENDLRALWRVVRNLYMSYASSSEDILRSEVSSFDPVASTTASYISFATYGYNVQNEVVPQYDSYVVFGEAGRYFTLSLSTSGYDKEAGEYSEVFNQILSTIRLRATAESVE